MKRTNACLLLVLLALLLGTFPLAAQVNVPDGCTTAQAGDSLWRIADRELGNPDLWERRLYDKNPSLHRKGRRYVNPQNQWTYVHILQGEVICGIDELGIDPIPATTDDLKKMGFSTPVVTVEKTVETISPWSWLPLGLLALIVLVLLALYTFFRRDPTRVGAGRVLEHGIQTPTQAISHIREGLVREFGVQGTFLPIISLVRGRGYGWAQVIDRAGSFFRRILRGDEMWQATVQLANGRQEIRYTLLGCANDVRAGGGMTPGWGFRFEAEENVAAQIFPPAGPAPVEVQPEPVAAAIVPEPPAPVPAPTPVVPTVDVHQNRRFSFDLTPRGGVYAKMTGFGNLRIEEDAHGTVIVRADKINRNAENS